MARRVTTDADEIIPAYVDVYNRLYGDIVRGHYELGARLPGEVELAAHYGVGRHTLRQALVILVEDGLVQKQKGSGNYLCRRLPEFVRRAARFSNPLTAFARRDIDDVRIQHNYGPPTGIAQSRLGLDASQLVLAANCVYRAGGVVIGHSFVQIPAAIIQAAGVDLRNEAQIETLIDEGIYALARSAELFYRVIAAEGDIVRRMEICEGQALVYIEQILRGKQDEGIARCKYYLLAAEYDIHFTLG